jgi:hypothetical protein
MRRSTIEIVRISELERLLGHRIRDPLMDSIFWESRLARHADLQSRIRRSTWGPRADTVLTRLSPWAQKPACRHPWSTAPSVSTQA